MVNSGSGVLQINAGLFSLCTVTWGILNPKCSREIVVTVSSANTVVSAVLHVLKITKHSDHSDCNTENMTKVWLFAVIFL